MNDNKLNGIFFFMKRILRLSLVHMHSPSFILLNEFLLGIRIFFVMLASAGNNLLARTCN